eukprot:sb/3470972/
MHVQFITRSSIVPFVTVCLLRTQYQNMNIDDILLAAALLCLAILMVLGLLHIKKTIRMTSDRLLPMYAQDLEQSKTIASNAHLISENVAKRLASVTMSLQRLQEVVERELTKKRPVYCTSTTQTMMVDTTDSATFTSPRNVESVSTSSGPSPREILGWLVGWLERLELFGAFGMGSRLTMRGFPIRDLPPLGG